MKSLSQRVGLPVNDVNCLLFGISEITVFYTYQIKSVKGYFNGIGFISGITLLLLVARTVLMLFDIRRK